MSYILQIVFLHSISPFESCTSKCDGVNHDKIGSQQNVDKALVGGEGGVSSHHFFNRGVLYLYSLSEIKGQGEENYIAHQET